MRPLRQEAIGIIVHLYEEYGEDFVSHLRGEFAIGLLDQRNEVLYLVRDRFGIKPLFYSRLNDSLVVAASSEKLGLEKGSEFSAHYLDSSAIRNTGLFNPQVVAGLRRISPTFRAAPGS
ncbi:MAG TPA: hypothetical protein VFE27_22900 [Acidobacteriaceae bacterium]|nr:hypothetical protein [Acidobacteriaceae bacterium]